MNIIFYNETTSAGRYQVMSTVEVEGEGVIKISDSTIHGHKCEVYKNLKHYWVSKQVLETLKSRTDLQIERTCF